MSIVSAQGVSFWLNDTYFGGPDYNVLVLGRDDPGWSGLKRTLHEIPNRDGGEFEGACLKPVTWTVPCKIMAESETQVRARLESVLFALNTEEEVRLVFDSRPDVFFMVSATEASGAKWDAGQGSLSMDLVFQLADPTGYAVEETEQVFTITTTPQTFSVLAGTLEKGNVAPWPTWIIEAGASTTLVTITNNTTGQAYSESTDLESGDFVKLDTKLNEKFASTNGINYNRSMAGGIGNMPRLKPRATNSITLEGLGAGTLRLQYRERFAAIIR